MGAICAVFVVFWSQKKLPPPPIVSPAPVSPYQSAIYGAGLIEASTENISIGSPFILPIEEIFVVEGNRVSAGQPLFRLDTRSFEAQKQTALCQLQTAIINYENAKTQFSFYERLQDKKAVSEKDYENSYYTMKEAEELVKVSRSNVKQVQTDIERATVRAPVDGEILQVNVHVGEIYPLNSYNVVLPYVNLPASLILMGTMSPLQMRVDIDEEDSWKFRKDAPATAFVRGNAKIGFPLKYARTEPYILPKVSYTGNNIERIDTRVLQVLYRFEKGDLPVYPGQLLDVFVEVLPPERSGGENP